MNDLKKLSRAQLEDEIGKLDAQIMTLKDQQRAVQSEINRRDAIAATENLMSQLSPEHRQLAAELLLSPVQPTTQVGVPTSE